MASNWSNLKNDERSPPPSWWGRFYGNPPRAPLYLAVADVLLILRRGGVFVSVPLRQPVGTHAFIVAVKTFVSGVCRHGPDDEPHPIPRRSPGLPTTGRVAFPLVQLRIHTHNRFSVLSRAFSRGVNICIQRVSGRLMRVVCPAETAVRML